MAVVFVARSSFADHYTVPSGSMEPTVLTGDQICVNKLAYGLRVPETHTILIRGADPARGDVVVLSSPADGEVLLKRVVAVPGDEVRVIDGRVEINGAMALLHERDGAVVEDLGGREHPLGEAYGGGPDFGPTRVPEDRYLVLGDNRGNSRDGRSFGWVERDAILGHAIAVCMRNGRPVWRGL